MVEPNSQLWPCALLPSPSTKLQRDQSYPQKESLNREESVLALLPVSSFLLRHLPNPPWDDRDILSTTPCTQRLYEFTTGGKWAGAVLEPWATWLAPMKSP